MKDVTSLRDKTTFKPFWYMQYISYTEKTVKKNIDLLKKGERERKENWS